MATGRRAYEPPGFAAPPKPRPLITEMLCWWGGGCVTYSSLKSSSAAAGVKTSSRPMTCGDGDRADERRRAAASGRSRGAATDVLVLHVLQQPQLPVGPAAVDQGLERPGQLLHRHLLPRDHVVRRAGPEDGETGRRGEAGVRARG